MISLSNLTCERVTQIIVIIQFKHFFFFKSSCLHFVVIFSKLKIKIIPQNSTQFNQYKVEERLTNIFSKVAYNNNGQSFLCIFSVDSPKLIFFPQINLLIRLFNYPIVWGYLLITAECYIKHCCYRLLFNDLNWCCVYWHQQWDFIHRYKFGQGFHNFWITYHSIVENETHL